MIKDIIEHTTMPVPNISIDKELNPNNDKMLFSKKMEKAKAIIAKAGLPQELYDDDAPTAQRFHQIEFNQLGFFVKQTRLQRNLSQKALADLVGIDTTLIIKLESNDNTLPISLIFQVFHVLDAELSVAVKQNC